MSEKNKYIILGNGTGWCRSCWKAAVDNDRVRFFPKMLPLNSEKFLYNICFTHYRFRSPWLKIFPFTSIWYKKLESSLTINDDFMTYLIIYDWNFITKDFNFLNYLRNNHPHLKIVYLFSNIVKVTGAKTYHILDQLNENYDKVFAFDKLDAEKYNFSYNPLIYTTNLNIPYYSDDLEYDLFYIGNAKDRYNQLLEIFLKAKSEGLKCNFNIVGVPKEKQINEIGIQYHSLEYSMVIKMMAKSKCFVDIIQGDSTGLTIKTCEAVVLGRKLLTSNENIITESFYNQSNIMLYDKKLSIKDFINKPFLNFSDQDKFIFSPEALFEKFDS